MAEEQRRSGLGGLGDGIRTGIGILSAFRDAVEETLQEAVERGDLSPERARRAVQDVALRLQEGVEEARDRVDFVSRRELEALQQELADLRARVARLEGGASGPAETPSGIIITE